MAVPKKHHHESHRLALVAHTPDESNRPTIEATPPVLVLSDLHLGHPATFLQDPRMAAPLFEGVRTVIFNGDTFESLNLKRSHEARDKLMALFDIVRAAGAKPFLISGNHDPDASNIHFLDLLGGKIFITHGDILHPGIAPWSRDAPVILAERRRLLARQPPPAELDELLWLTKRSAAVACRFDHEVVHENWLARVEYVARFAFEPWRILMALYYWANVAHYSRAIHDRFRPAAKVMLIGHTHRAGVWRNRDFTLINTGSYHPLSQALAVLIHDHRISVRQAIRQKDVFTPGREIYHVSLD